MFKTVASALALAAALSFTAAPASAGERHHNLGFAALAIGVIGAAIGAQIASHAERSTHDRSDYGSRDYGYRPEYAPVAVPSDEFVRVCPRGTHLGRHGNSCWSN